MNTVAWCTFSLFLPVVSIAASVTSGRVGVLVITTLRALRDSASIVDYMVTHFPLRFQIEVNLS